ncbi:hypothetical protein ACO0LD_13900 [Undibacterium sp. Ji83W]|uniref:hypothetical protein n=1 Tax=Undibacterium sp. Ji83W TaxID=3413043 RepID=UPI003BF1D4C9
MSRILQMLKHMQIARVLALTVLTMLSLCLPSAASAQSTLNVKLEQAVFQGLTGIKLRSSVPLSGITAADILVRRADGLIVAANDILDVKIKGDELTISLSASVFARISAKGTTVASRSFGKFAATRPIPVLKTGEPTENGYLIGTSGWTDEGWNTVVTDPTYVDTLTGQRGMYRFSNTRPDRDTGGHLVAKNAAATSTPTLRTKTMLVLFVEFPDRKAADAEAQYKQFSQFGPYLNYLQPAANWFNTSSYGQLQLKLVSPQHNRKLDWLMLGKNAKDYKWGGNTEDTGDMFHYAHDVAQLAYERYGIRVDAYDLLLIIPAQGKSGLPNGPATINDQYMGQTQVPSRVVMVERDGKAHTLGTFVTAGNDLFIWGYRWLIHETGHTFGLPDLYMYKPEINGKEVDRFFYVGGWDMMGNIGGQSPDFLAWHKWKMHWIRDDQVDVVSHASELPSHHVISPVEMPGGSKMVVIRTGLATAYVAEFRTRLGVNSENSQAKQAGVLLYRLDASLPESGEKPVLQIISRQYYHSPEVGGERNLTGVWRPVNKSLDGYEQGATWQAGDVFSDPATGVTIRIDSIANSTDTSKADGRIYTEEDTASITVIKRSSAQLNRKMILANATLRKLRHLHFTVDVEQAAGEPNWFVLQRSRLSAEHVLLRQANGKVIPADQIKSLKITDQEVAIEFKPGTFTNPKMARGLQLATRPYFNIGAAIGIPVRMEP